MSTTGENRGGGFGEDDFALFARMDAGEAPADAVDDLWDRARALLDGLGAALFGEGAAHADLWPEGAGDEGDRFPFLWGRLKRTGNQRFATHIGVFVSPGLCNLAIDLEKDLLDAGDAAETLEEYVGFFAAELPSVTGPVVREDLKVWTDTRNVVAARDFAGVDFAGFMAANRDAGHPWPKIGYIMDAAEVQGFGDRWVDQYRDRAEPLVAVYDAMIRSFAG